MTIIIAGAEGGAREGREGGRGEGRQGAATPRPPKAAPAADAELEAKLAGMDPKRPRRCGRPWRPRREGGRCQAGGSRREDSGARPREGRQGQGGACGQGRARGGRAGAGGRRRACQARRRKVSSMGKATVIPFGPQHPVLPEPLHLDLVVEDENGHRGHPADQASSTAGWRSWWRRATTTSSSTWPSASAASAPSGTPWATPRRWRSSWAWRCPRRAEYLRVIWHELSRIHSHMLWMGLAADAFGFESLFMHCWRLRERVLDIFEKTTGGRVIFSVVKVGGVVRDIDDGPDGRDQAHAGRHQGRLPADLRRVPEGLAR